MVINRGTEEMKTGLGLVVTCANEGGGDERVLVNVAGGFGLLGRLIWNFM